MDTFKLLKHNWQAKHFNHLTYCLTYCQAYFEDHFEYEVGEDNSLLINGKKVSQDDILKILSAYYDDRQGDYFSSFGDTLYLFFTDLVEADVDILALLDEEVA